MPLFILPNLICAFWFALAIWFAAHSVSAVITITEPDIDDGDRRHRMNQASSFAAIAAFFALIFFASFPK